VVAAAVSSQTIAVRGPSDVEHARRNAQALARELHFSFEDVERVAIAVSELAMNLLRHAQRGEMRIETATDQNRIGLRIESADQGPGISDVKRVMTDGFSTTGGLGSGLPAARRLMDDFEIETSGEGTRIVGFKWHAR
jgi:serine/threonine-protein kinase RsbT